MAKKAQKRTGTERTRLGGKRDLVRRPMASAYAKRSARGRFRFRELDEVGQSQKADTARNAKTKVRRGGRPKSLDRLEPFEDGYVLVVIETPKGSPNKLAYEPRFGTFVLKGVLPAGAVFPFDFGFVPSTRAEDGDPVDVLVLMDAPVFPGCIVPSRLLGVIEAEQTEDGKTERNDRILAVAANSATHRSIRELGDLSPDLVAQIEHFFVSYNEMKGKQFRVERRAGKKRALTLVTTALTRRQTPSSGGLRTRPV